MKNALIDAIDKFASARTSDDRWDVATKMAADMGFHNILVAHINGTMLGIDWINTNMPDSWMEQYLSEGYVELDKLVHGLSDRNGSMAIESGHLRADEAASRRHLDLDHGMRSAGLASLHCSRFGTLGETGTYVTLVSDTDVSKTLTRSPIDAQALSGLLAVSVAQPIASRSNEILRGKAFALTQRQKDVLSLLANGHQTSGIAYRLGLTEAAVNKHFQAAKTKLDANTREHALAIAMQAGVIEL